MLLIHQIKTTHLLLPLTLKSHLTNKKTTNDILKTKHPKLPRYTTMLCLPIMDSVSSIVYNGVVFPMAIKPRN